MKKQEIEQTEQTAIAVQDEDDDSIMMATENGVALGADISDEFPIRPFRITLAQGLSDCVSKGLARPGEIVETVTGQSWKEVELIVVQVKRTAVLWARELEDIQEDIPTDAGDPVCQSQDGKTGSYYGDCLNCQFCYKDWPIRDGKRRPPICTEQMNFISMLGGLLVNVAMAKSSSGTGQGIYAQLRAFADNKANPKPFFAHVFKLYAEEKIFPNKQKSFVFRAKWERPTTSEEFSVALAKYQELKNATVEIEHNAEDQQGGQPAEPAIPSAPDWAGTTDC